MLFQTKVAKAHYTILKSDITSFLVSFKKKYNRFPIKDLGRVSRINYSSIRKFVIHGVSMEPKIAVREIKKKYVELGKNVKPSYFNPILRSFLQDAKKCKTDEEEKSVFSSYKEELKSEFKQFDIDLLFCVNGLSEVTKSLHNYNNENKQKEKIENG